RARARRDDDPAGEQRRPVANVSAGGGRPHGLAVRAIVPRAVRSIGRMRVTPRAGVLVLIWLAAVPARASAEWQFKPFLGATFAGGTTFVDLEEASGHPNLSVG